MLYRYIEINSKVASRKWQIVHWPGHQGDDTSIGFRLLIPYPCVQLVHNLCWSHGRNTPTLCNQQNYSPLKTKVQYNRNYSHHAEAYSNKTHVIEKQKLLKQGEQTKYKLGILFIHLSIITPMVAIFTQHTSRFPAIFSTYFIRFIKWFSAKEPK